MMAGRRRCAESLLVARFDWARIRANHTNVRCSLGRTRPKSHSCALWGLPEVTASGHLGWGWMGGGRGGNEQTSSWFSSSTRTPLRPCSATITVAMQHRPNTNAAKATDAPTLDILLVPEGPNREMPRNKRARSVTRCYLFGFLVSLISVS